MATEKELQQENKKLKEKLKQIKEIIYIKDPNFDADDIYYEIKRIIEENKDEL